MIGWWLFLFLWSAISATAPAPPAPYFNEKDVYHVNCWPVDVPANEAGLAAANAAAQHLRDIGYEYFGTETSARAGNKVECNNWRDVIELKDKSFAETGFPSGTPFDKDTVEAQDKKSIDIEYYADHNQCRWLPLHSGDKVLIDLKVDEDGNLLDIFDGVDGIRPASGPWCYTNKKNVPSRCLKYCGDAGTYVTERKRPEVPHKRLVRPPALNHNQKFTEQLGSIFAVEPAQRAMIYVKPSMEDHSVELLAAKRNVFYACCGVVGAVILWITVCHFLELRVKQRRLPMVEIQRQAISATITRRRRESQQERDEEEDARAP